MKAKYIPNILSSLRLMLVFLFVYAYYNEDIYKALLIFIIAGATDVLDGILARKFNWITNLGKILDPIADKSMQCTVLICMSTGPEPLIPWWFAAFFIVKEILMGAGTIFVFKKRDTVVSSRWAGKLAVCIFYATIFIIITLQPSKAVVMLLSLVTISFGTLAFVSYTRRYMKKSIESQTEQLKPDGQ